VKKMNRRESWFSHLQIAVKTKRLSHSNLSLIHNIILQGCEDEVQNADTKRMNVPVRLGMRIIYCSCTLRNGDNRMTAILASTKIGINSVLIFCPHLLWSAGQ
jgi:hypothetical protein